MPLLNRYDHWTILFVPSSLRFSMHYKRVVQTLLLYLVAIHAYYCATTM